MLDGNASFLTKEQLDQHVARLNTKEFQLIDTEWEVAVLHAFSKAGKAEHEPALEGTSKLDLLFTDNKESQLLTDIVTVSDEGYEKKTGVRAFEVELKKRLGDAGLLYRGWMLAVGSHPITKYGERAKPALPPRNEFAKEIFNSKFKQFLKLVKDRPSQSSTYCVTTEKTAITLIYKPDYKYFMSQLPVNSPAVTKNQNPVFNALRMKAKQLKKVRFGGPKGIILCDGGTDMVHSKPHGAFEFNFNAVDATKDFLRQNQSIDFVLMLSSVLTNSGRYGPTKPPFRKVQVTVIPNKRFDRLPDGIKETLTRLEQYFPEPENTPDGARETIRHGYDPKDLRPLAGGWEVSDKKIKVSASAVFALLAGAVKQDELFESLDFKPQSTKTSAIRNPFAHMLSRKMRIEKIQVEETPFDESYLVFHFDGPDPALSSFRNPKA